MTRLTIKACPTCMACCFLPTEDERGGDGCCDVRGGPGRAFCTNDLVGGLPWAKRTCVAVPGSVACLEARIAAGIDPEPR